MLWPPQGAGAVGSEQVMNELEGRIRDTPHTLRKFLKTLESKDVESSACIFMQGNSQMNYTELQAQCR